MYAEIHIEMDNAAFDDTPGIELARILNKLATTVRNDPILDEHYQLNLMDINGNTVGYLRIRK